MREEIWEQMGKSVIPRRNLKESESRLGRGQTRRASGLRESGRLLTRGLPGPYTNVLQFHLLYTETTISSL